MASETTFSDIRRGYSVSKSFYDATAKVSGRDSFITWCFDELKKWPHFSNLFSSLGPSELLIQSLSHTSFVHENSAYSIKAYERLEFLGDAVLDLIVSKNLLSLYPDLEEGELSKLRGALVNETNLAKLAKAMNLGSVLLLGKGESKNGGHEKNAILADVVESTIAVFFQEQGMSGAENYFNKLVEIYERELEVNFFDLSHLDSFDSKTKLQEKTMALFKEHPVYESIELEDGRFEVSVKVKNCELSRIIHVSKKKAEKILAKKIMNEKLYEEVINVN